MDKRYCAVISLCHYDETVDVASGGNDNYDHEETFGLHYFTLFFL